MTVRASRLVVGAAVAILAWNAPLAGQQPMLRIEAARTDTVVVPAADRGSVAFRIVNPSATEATATVRAVVPPGWRSVVPGQDLRVPAGGTVVRIVSFYPPAEAVGAYSVGLELASAGGVIGSAAVPVLVPERHALEVEILESPTWVTAGEAYAVLARVSNLGNAAEAFSVEINSPYDIPAVSDTRSETLAPGEAREIRVIVTPPEDLSRAVTHTLRIGAVGADARADAVARVEIIPARHGRTRPTGIPAELRVRASEDQRAGPPVRFQAAGPIRPGSETRVNLLLQGPTPVYSIFGEPDIYQLTLRSPRFSLALGDNAYRLSQLTEPGRRGFGVGGSARVGAVIAGGFVQTDRRSFTPDSQIAAFAGIEPLANLSLRGNWLRTMGSGARHDLVSAEGRFDLPHRVRVRAEWGLRPDNQADSRNLELSAGAGPIGINLSHIDVDPSYRRELAGLSTNAAHVYARPWRELFFEASVREQATRPSTPGTGFEGVQRSMRLATRWGSRITVEGLATERRGASASLVTVYSGRSVRVSLGLPLGPVFVYPLYETGIARDAADAAPQSFWRAGGRATLITGPISLSSNVEYFTGGTLHRVIDERGVRAAGTAALRFASTELRLSSNLNRSLGPIRRDHISIDAAVTHALPFGHRISARVMRRASDGLFQRDDVLAMLDYSVPLRIPTGSAGRTTGVSATLRDGATGAPLRNVIVHVGGHRVATDRRGRVTIRGLEPGVHYLDIDRSTTATGAVADAPLPMRLDLKAGETRDLQLVLVPGGKLAVGVTIVRGGSASGRSETSAPEPLERTVVDFVLGTQRIRRQTDSRGEIELSGLRPGRWTVKIVGADLPSFHRFDRDSAVVEVTGGTRGEVRFSAAPVRRRIEIVATADLTEQPAGAAADRKTPAARAGAGISAEVSPAASESGRAAGTPAPAHDRGRVVQQSPATPLGVPAASPADRTPPVALGEPVTAPARPEEGDAQRRAPPVPIPRAEPPQAERAEGYTITVVAGDRSLRNIAALVYGDRDLWPRIFLANVGVVRHPDELFAGQVLRIPPAGPLTPEERAIARRFPERE